MNPLECFKFQNRKKHMLKIVWRVKKGRKTWKSISSSDKTHQNLPKYQRVKNNASKRHDSTQTPCKLNSVLNVARRLSIIWAPFSNCSFKLHCRLNILRVFYCRIRWIRMHVRIKYINHWKEKEHSLFAFGFKTAGVIFKRNKCKSSCVLHTEGINIGEKTRLQSCVSIKKRWKQKCIPSHLPFVSMNRKEERKKMTIVPRTGLKWHNNSIWIKNYLTLKLQRRNKCLFGQKMDRMAKFMLNLANKMSNAALLLWHMWWFAAFDHKKP